MTLSTVLSAVLGAILALTGNAVATYLADRRKARYRWDELAFSAFAAFAVSSRTARDGAARLSEALAQAQSQEAKDEARARFDVLQAKMRGDFDQMALVGSPETILAGREVLRKVYYLRQLAGEGVVPHDDQKWNQIHTDLMIEQKAYYREARAQLKMPAGPDPGPGVDPKPLHTPLGSEAAASNEGAVAP